MSQGHHFTMRTTGTICNEKKIIQYSNLVDMLAAVKRQKVTKSAYVFEILGLIRGSVETQNSIPFSMYIANVQITIMMIFI